MYFLSTSVQNQFYEVLSNIFPNTTFGFSSLLIFYRTQVNLGSDLWVRMSVRLSLRVTCVDLTDVTLADEDTNSILTDNTNRAM